MDLPHFRMINNEFLNKDPDVVPQQALLIVLDIKSYVCMANIGKDINHTRHITRIMQFVRNGQERNLHK